MHKLVHFRDALKYLYYIWRNIIKCHFFDKKCTKSDKKVQTSVILIFCAESVHSSSNFCKNYIFCTKIFNQKSLSFSILKSNRIL